MYRTNHKRLFCLEAALLESQIARLQEHYRSLTREDLDLILEIADGQRAGTWPREYTPAEVEKFNSHCEFLSTFPDSVHDENSRRTMAELLDTGKITRAEIIERWGPEYLPK